jgi:hypothetical protein
MNALLTVKEKAVGIGSSDQPDPHRTSMGPPLFNGSTGTSCARCPFAARDRTDRRRRVFCVDG